MVNCIFTQGNMLGHASLFHIQTHTQTHIWSVGHLRMPSHSKFYTSLRRSVCQEVTRVRHGRQTTCLAFL